MKKLIMFLLVHVSPNAIFSQTDKPIGAHIYKGTRINPTATYYFNPKTHTFKRFHKIMPDRVCGHITVYPKGLKAVRQFFRTGTFYVFRNFKKGVKCNPWGIK